MGARGFLYFHIILEKAYNIKDGKGWYNGIQTGIMISRPSWISNSNLAQHTKDNRGKQLFIQDSIAHLYD